MRAPGVIAFCGLAILDGSARQDNYLLVRTWAEMSEFLPFRCELWPPRLCFSRREHTMFAEPRSLTSKKGYRPQALDSKPKLTGDMMR